VTRRVQWEPAALVELRALPREIARRVGRAVERFAQTGHGDVRKLEGQQGRYRLRVGDFRVIYRIGDQGLIVIVLHVRNRRDAYRR
jgi:mRNA interferase RelE/StbE